MLRAIALAVVSRPMGFRHVGAGICLERASRTSTSLGFLSAWFLLSLANGHRSQPKIFSMG